MTASEAYKELVAKPDYFLKHYPIAIAGAAGAHQAGQANIRTFYLTKKDPTSNVPGQTVGHYGATRPGRIFSSQKHDISSFTLATYCPPGANNKSFSCLSVPMLTYDANAALPLDLTNLDHYLLDGSANVMVTGQLSGCTFCWLPVGGQLWCTHIKPTNIDGVRLQNLLNTSGRFNGSNHSLATFGRNDYAAFTTIIGVQSSGSWRLYAQLSNDRNATNALVYRLYPGVMTIL